MNSRPVTDWKRDSETGEEHPFVTIQMRDNNSTAERPIDWLVDVLRGENADVHVSYKRAPEGHVEIERYTAFPTDSEPKLLISANSRKVRAAALRRVGSESSTTMRMIRRIGSELARAGLDQLATGADLVFSVPATKVADAPGDREPMTLLEYLESSLGLPGLHIAVTIGPLRPNRKPVLQVMDADGDLVAFAKVGWDDSTTRMVAREAVVLTDLEGSTLRDVIAPRVLHYGEWHGLTVLATEPLDHPDAGVPSEHLIRIGVTEISRHRGVSTLPLDDSEWLRQMTERAGRADRRDDDLVNVVTALTAKHGSTMIGFGFSHGDWAPWNMARLGRRLGVWDWERASQEAPLGIDLVHFSFQKAFHANGGNVHSALAIAIAETSDGIELRGRTPHPAELVAVAYLLELALRYDESGLATDPKLSATRDRLIAELTSRINDMETHVDVLHATASDKQEPKKMFGRRMLGGSGVPAPITATVKGAASIWGRASAERRVLPNTFIIGAQRCGTTSLFRYLTQHPSVAGPRLEKGVHYFDTNFDRSIDWYRSHFPTERTARVSRQKYGCDLRVVEACPYYAFHPFVPGRMAEVIDNPRFVLLVRDPAARALSHHNHEVTRGFEDETFERALDLEASRLDGEAALLRNDSSYVSYAHQHHSYVARGHYEEQLARYDEVFGPESTLVVRTSDLESDPAATVATVLSFLGVELSANFSFPRFNARAYTAMQPALEERLRAEFEPTDQAIADRLGLTDPWT